MILIVFFIIRFWILTIIKNILQDVLHGVIFINQIVSVFIMRFIIIIFATIVFDVFISFTIIIIAVHVFLLLRCWQ
jgi:hypothetical protein